MSCNGGLNEEREKERSFTHTHTHTKELIAMKFLIILLVCDHICKNLPVGKQINFIALC